MHRITPQAQRLIRQITKDTNASHVRKVKRLFQSTSSMQLRVTTQHRSIITVRGMVTITKTSTSASLSTDPMIQVNTSSMEEGSGTIAGGGGTIQDNDALIITESTIRQVRHLAPSKNSSSPDSVYLRVYVDAGGCSGFQYKFELKYETPSDEESLIDPQDDVVITASLRDGSLVTRVVIDDASLDLLRGSKVDFIQEMIRSSFAVVENPQSESACGCGSSFAVKNFESNPALD